MALKAIIASLNEVDEKYRDLYTAKGDKFEFTGVEGVKTQADIDRLQTALANERKAHGVTAAAAKETADKLAAFGELTPEQIEAQAEKLANFEAAGTPELTKNFEKIVSDRVAAQLDARLRTETAKLTKQINDLTTQSATVTAENQKFKQNDLQRTIDDNVRAAAAKAKVQDGAVVDALMRARSAFTVAEDGRVVTADGQTADEWIEARKADAGHWWPVARGAGANGGDGGNFSASDNPWTANNWNMTKQSALVASDPAKAERMAVAAGSKVGAARPTLAQA